MLRLPFLFGVAFSAIAAGVTGSEAALSRPVTTGAMPASLFVAPKGSDKSSCTSRRSPCASFDRVYTMARPGQVIEVAGGVYPHQAIRARKGRRGPNVVLRPARGARPVLGGLSIRGADFVTVRRMTMTYQRVGMTSRNQHGIWVGPGSTHVTLEHMDAGSIDSWFAKHLTVRGGDYGPCNAVATNEAKVCGNNKQDVSSDVLIDGATFHGLRMDGSCFQAGADCHWEAMYLNATHNTTVRNSRFFNNTLYNIFVTISGPDAERLGHKNLRIENNWFATPWREGANDPARPARPTGISLAWCQNSPHGYQNVLVRFNSFSSSTGVELDGNRSCVFRNVRVVGNLLQYPGSCASNVTYAYNVWSTSYRAGRCSTTDRMGSKSLPYRNGSVGAKLDYRLPRARRTLADDLVPTSAPGGCPRRDSEGQKRPMQRRCDAGSDERISPPHRRK